jgi:predicted transposase YdaD
MCEAFQELFKDEINRKVEDGRLEGRQQGRLEGRQQGRLEGRQLGKQDAMISSIKNLMASMKFTVEQAMDALGIPQEEQSFYIEKIIRR